MIIFPLEKTVNSVLPPPTSTYKYDLSPEINSCRSVEEMISASSFPLMMLIFTPVF